MYLHFMNREIEADEFRELLSEDPDGWILDGDKHRISSEDGQHIYRLPMIWPSAERNEATEDYLSRIPEEEPLCLLLLVQLGAAAIGLFEGENIFAHKSIKKYMKRHKRGKSQVNYLNTRGKSKAGSRIRLANTERFFEEINERIADWGEMYDEPGIIFISATPNVWGMMFQADPPPSFVKKDSRIRKVPYDVPVPDFGQLQEVAAKLRMACRT